MSKFQDVCNLLLNWVRKTYPYREKYKWGENPDNLQSSCWAVGIYKGTFAKMSLELLPPIWRLDRQSLQVH